MQKNVNSNKMQIELTGMSVRAVESLTKSVRMHRNPKYFGANAPLFLPHQILVGGPVVYVQGLFPKTTRALLSMFSNSPTVISVTVFCLGQLFDHNTLIRLYCPTRFIRGDMMRKLIYVLLIFITFCTHARTLHVGDNTIKLSEFKTTAPALHVRVGDEIWYGNMGRCKLPMNENTDKELKVRYNNTDYWVSEVGDYVIIDGKLIAANCNIYLESTGTQWIDTLHVPTLVTRSELELKFSDDNKKSDGYAGFFGITDYYDTKSAYELNFGSPGQYYNIYPWICAYNGDGGPSWCAARRLTITVEEKTTKQLVILDAKNNLLRYGNQTKVLQGRKTTEKESVILFGTRSTDKYNNKRLRSYQQTDAMYIYSTKIYEDDVLVRHFVPVPCGLQIGDFVVPSNGMWDIVEQKFYGNMGTGDFIYGVDE